MLTFLFVLCLIVAALVARIHLGLTIPPLIGAYLIARFTNFTKVSDRECMALIALSLIAAAAFFVIRSWF